MEQIIAIDEQLLLAINSCHNEYWDMFMYWISDKWVWIPFYATILYAIFKSYGWRTAVMFILITALAITAADQICSHMIRPAVQRLRPSNPNNPLSEFVHIVNDHRGGRYGFPSSHAANTFAAATLTAMVLRRLRYTVFAFAWAVLVCYSRMYLGVHFPGDILAGLTIGVIIGFAFGVAAGSILDWWNRRHEEKSKMSDFRQGVPAASTRIADLPIATGLLTIALIAIFA